MQNKNPDQKPITSKQTVQWSPETNNLTRTTGETGLFIQTGLIREWETEGEQNTGEGQDNHDNYKGGTKADIMCEYLNTFKVKQETSKRQQEK